MTTFAFGVQVTDAIKDTISAALGAAAGYTDKDVGKPVKMGTANNYVICDENDPIEGFIESLEPSTVNQGISFGSVQRKGRKLVEVAAGETVALLGYVMADAQTTAGVISTGANEMAKVKPAVATAATDDGSLTGTGLFTWRVIRIVSGNGSAGSVVLIERV